ncbi:ATP-dependent DNA helicase RecG [Merismopedia glauca]|uniref:ATP-dependent DNA helicase RecG n=1 Tax=Merismopedia glauca CCAP 1448/3 TaxID=1296344 RepID=A0A2T1C9B9_9CYAN|nr:ATP-dependent DNA helicase RecG [Merismopedia glauca]PSB04834.1 DNA helicase RecG [Merismopedia glauca CCAP 1448/3]
MSDRQIDWIKLQKALAIEVETGFRDIVGKQYRFSEFLCLNLGDPSTSLSLEHKRQCQELASRFAQYPGLELSDRQHLIAKTRHFILQVRQTSPNPEGLRVAETAVTGKIPVTKPLVAFDSEITPDRPLLYLPKVGARKADVLAKLGLQTVRDLLFYYPRDHIDYARQINISQLQAGETVTILGTVRRCTCFTSPKNKKLTILEIIIEDRSGKIRLSRFLAGDRYSHRGRQETIKRQYPPGAVVAASGLVENNKYGLTLKDPQIEVLGDRQDAIDSVTIGRIVPIYPLTEGIAAETIRQAVIEALPAAKRLRDPFPRAFREGYGLIPLKDAIANIHFPENHEIKQAARRRLVFDEFFYLQLGFLQRRNQLRQSQTAASLAPTGKLIEEFYNILPFQLTKAQQRVINDVLKDLQKPNPMNRLIQGDVGSGKTVVAVIAILIAIQSGYQAALMAPTEVLAEQHYRKLISWFNLLHLPVELLTGSTKTAKRREIHSQLQTGELPLLVGTHALIQETVNFAKLGFVVIDEQHRFGVKQRATLLAKGEAPHVLTMTATPIPRTLALTMHGDLDVSQIDELPPGRQAIQTSILSGKERSQAYDLMRREIAQGRQVYIVFPLVEESEKLDVRAAVAEHEQLAESIFPEFQVGLLHGRMTSAEKDEAITAFRDNITQILVATTVVEVGVDVPNATVMMIENAERFGLSQLHQLRGRVGRGHAKSFCLLMTGSKSQNAMERLKVLEQSQDGFFISEMDLRFRGPGEVLGTRQTGLADFALASLVEDGEVLEIARDAAEKVLMQDESLASFPLMQAELNARYEKLMGGAILT